ncbi:MAG: hypothetical protein ACOCTG_04245 [Bacteroidota bacterium]
MQFLLDNAIAVLVAGAILLTIFGVRLRGQEASIDVARYYDARHGTQALVAFVEQDFNNVGAGMLNPTFAIKKIDTTSATRVFEFYARTDPAVPDSQVVAYSWKEEGSVELKDKSTVPTYKVTRTVDGVVSGSSFDSVTHFGITLYNDSLNVISSAAQLPRTRRIDVMITAVSGLGAGETVEQVRWYRRIRPANLFRLEGGSVMVPAGP